MDPNQNRANDQNVPIEPVTQSPAQEPIQPMQQEPIPTTPMQPEQEPPKSKNNLGLIILVIGLVLIVSGAAAYYFLVIKKIPISSGTASPTSSATTTASVKNTNTTAEVAELQKLVIDGQKVFKGVVTLSDTVCKNATIISATDSSMQVANGVITGRPVKSDGSFIVIASTKGPQAIMLMNDQQEICLDGVSFPDSTDEIAINAKTTATSSVYPIGFLIVDASGYAGVQSLKSFTPFYQYLRAELKTKTLSAIATTALDPNSTYFKLTNAVNDELTPILSPKIPK